MAQGVAQGVAQGDDQAQGVQGGAHPSRLVTCLLNLLLPGAGLLYWERHPRGSRLMLASVTYLLACLALWFAFPFHTKGLAALCLTPWLLAQGYLFMLLWRAPPAHLSWSRHPSRLSVALGALAVALSPLILLSSLLFFKVILWVKVSDQGLFPLALKGDVLAVDRRVIAPSELSPGELVVINCAQRGPVLRRFVTYAARGPLLMTEGPLGELSFVSADKGSGGSVASRAPTARLTGALTLEELEQLEDVLDARFAWSDELTRQLLKEAPWEPEERALIEAYRWRWERFLGEEGAHLSATRRFPKGRPKARVERVEVGELFVRSDRRGEGKGEGSCEGAFHASKLLGRPLYVHRGASPYTRREGLSLVP